MTLTKHPKHAPEWKSLQYRSWIRNHKDCFVCGASLLEEKPDFLTHHAFNSGGKHPRDGLLVPLCLLCHNKHHHGDKKLQFPDYVWLAQARKCLSEYMEKVLNYEPEFICINALTDIVREL